MDDHGLTNEEIVVSREKYGSNKIEAKNENSFIKLLIESLGDPIIRILLIVLAVAVIINRGGLASRFEFSDHNKPSVKATLLPIIGESLSQEEFVVYELQHGWLVHIKGGSKSMVFVPKPLKAD